MIRWYWDKFMYRVGYVKVWYLPCTKYQMPMADFWCWEFRPDLKPGVYQR